MCIRDRKYCILEEIYNSMKSGQFNEQNRYRNFNNYVNEKLSDIAVSYTHLSVIGSFNMDMRSAYLDTELMLVILSLIHI